MEAQKREITLAVAGRIKYFRHLRSYSQEDLALRADINPAYFGQVERGLKCPTIDTLYKISKALDVPMPELLRTDSLPQQPTDQSIRIQALLSRVPLNKQEQVMRLIESLVELL